LAPYRSTLAARPFGGGAVEQARILQGTIGNQATPRYLTQRLSNPPANASAERHKQEAAPENMMSREAPRGLSWDFSKIPVFVPDQPNRDQPALRRVAPPPPGDIAPAIVNEILRSSGQPLDESLRWRMEPRFGLDFSHVRVHEGTLADQSARAINASAFTAGHHLVFAEGQYAPHTESGRKLIAHELAHVVQQSKGRTLGSQETLEQDAERASASFAGGNAVHVQGSSVPTVARQLAPSLSMTDPKALSNEDLAQKIVRVRVWLSNHQFSSVESDRLTADLVVLEAEAQRRVEHERVLEMQDRQPSSGTLGFGALAGVAIAAPSFGAASTAATTTATGATATTATGASAFGLVLAPVAAFLAVFLYPKPTVSNADEQRMLEEARQAQVLMAQQMGKVIRANTTQLMIHLARILGETVGGQPPDHQRDPERDRPHWWKEVKNFIQQIMKYGLSGKQLLRILREQFTEEQLVAIRAALRRAAQAVGEDPPDFPPTATP
jgi:hypothetical protein